MTNDEVKQHYEDLKTEAVAFGEWMLKNRQFRRMEYVIMSDLDKTWWETRDETQYTTEELYNLFLSSKQVSANFAG